MDNLADEISRNSSPRPWWLRSVFLLSMIGIALRLVTIGQPVVSSNGWIRQSQTADAARSIQNQRGWPMSSEANWRGDFGAHVLLELPIYTYLAAGMGAAIGSLDASGKIVSMLLWLASFLLVQRVWRRLLHEEEILAANLLFVFAPLAVAYGQAFSPEMLVVLLSVLFIDRILEYQDRPSGIGLMSVWLVGLCAVLVKLPAVSHLFLVFGYVLFKQHGWKAALMPRYWVFALALLASMKGWATYLDSVNEEFFSYWSASGNLDKFLGNFRDLLSWKGYARVAVYLTGFVLSPLGVLACLLGLRGLFRERSNPRREFVGVLVLSLIFFYLVWGPRTSFGHAYYNLIALIPLALLVGVGVGAFRRWLAGFRGEDGQFGAVAKLVIGSAVAGHFVCAGLGSYYLLRPDWPPYLAGKWLKENTKEEELILLKANHLDNSVNYFNLPAVFYHADRRGWHWTKGMPSGDREAASQRCQWLVETKRIPREGFLDKLRALRLKNVPPDSLDGIEAHYEMELVADEETFRVFKLTPSDAH